MMTQQLLKKHLKLEGSVSQSVSLLGHMIKWDRLASIIFKTSWKDHDTVVQCIPNLWPISSS